MEKHVPVIECADTVNIDTTFDVKVSIGKEIAHPNTTEHHISWVQLFFRPKGEKFTYQVGSFAFSAHGESVEGANQGSVYTHHTVTASLNVKKSGTLHALALCNIHGLWQSKKDIMIG